MADYRQKVSKVMELALANKEAEAYNYYNANVRKLCDSMQENLNELSLLNVNEAKEAYKKDSSDIKAAKVILFSVILLALVIAAFLVIVITKVITAPLSEIAAYVPKIAEGDLTETTLQKFLRCRFFNDETGSLGKSITEMRKKLWLLTKQVSDSAWQVAASSQEVNAGALQSAQAAASITQMAGGIQE